jgi:hypothetical protein
MSGNLPTNYFEAAGYGQNGDNVQTNKLSKVQLKNVPIDECQVSYDSVELSPDSQMCAQSYRDDMDTQDTWYDLSNFPANIYLKPISFQAMATAEVHSNS